jgi:MFS family permease
MLPSTVFMLTASILMGRISAVHGPRRTLLLGAGISAFAFLLLATLHDHIWSVVIAMSLSGFGTGLSFASMPALIVAAVEPSETGVATGVNTNIRNIGGCLGSQVSASLLAASTLTSGLPRESGFTAAFLVVSGMLCLSVLAGSAIPGRPRRQETAVGDLAAEGAPA